MSINCYERIWTGQTTWWAILRCCEQVWGCEECLFLSYVFSSLTPQEFWYLLLSIFGLSFCPKKQSPQVLQGRAKLQFQYKIYSWADAEVSHLFAMSALLVWIKQQSRGCQRHKTLAAWRRAKYEKTGTRMPCRPQHSLTAILELPIISSEPALYMQQVKKWDSFFLASEK